VSVSDAISGSAEQQAGPAVPAPFRWQDGHLRADWPGGGVLFTTRRGGVSRGPYAELNLGGSTRDDPRAVAANRATAAALAGVGPDDLVRGQQVHGTRVQRDAAPAPFGAELERADGQATTSRGAAVMVLTADCLPVTLVAPGAVAVVHAGWRGLAAGVVQAGVVGVRALGGDPVTAAIGPGAGGCCYEVGDEVRAAFAATHDGAGLAGDRHVDLKAAARARLAACSVAEIHDAGLCTICSDPALFFSHRRDAGVTGRQAGLAWRS